MFLLDLTVLLSEVVSKAVNANLNSVEVRPSPHTGECLSFVGHYSSAL